MDQLPCAHAIAVCKEMNLDPYKYCSSYHTKEAMIATYKESTYPVGNKDTWQIPEHIKAVEVKPPEGKIRVGRPKKRRCKPAWERNKKVIKETKCGNCRQSGHNQKTCRNTRQIE